MNQGKYRSTKVLRTSVLFFLFLNLLLISSPFIHASSSVYAAKDLSSFPIQHHSTEQDETNRPNHLADEQQEYHISTRNRQNTSSLYQRRKPDLPPVNDQGINYNLFHYPYLLIRPYYYIFLSLYHLF